MFIYTKYNYKINSIHVCIYVLNTIIKLDL